MTICIRRVEYNLIKTFPKEKKKIINVNSCTEEKNNRKKEEEKR